MKITLDEKKKKLVIEMDATVPPQASASGKMNILATTHGFATSEAKYKGKLIKVSVNVGVSAN